MSSSTADTALAPDGAGRRVKAQLRPGQRRRQRRGAALFALFAFPNLAIIAVFAYWPIIQNIYLSFTDWDFISPVINSVGFANYQSLFSAGTFSKVVGRTLIWVVCVVLISLVLGLAMALLFSMRLKGRSAVRTLSFAPHVLSGAAMATVWLFIFDPNYGLSRVIFNWFGADSPNWVNDAQWALPSLIIVSIWKGLGFVAIVYGVALEGIPDDVIEAAKLDGAQRFAMLRHVILPLISPTTFFLLITQTISAFQSFDVIAMMTGGGPAQSTTTWSWFIYDQAFNRTNIGVSSAASVLMFIVLVTITALQFRFVEGKVHY